MSDELPRGIPRKLVFRTLADVCDSQCRLLVDKLQPHLEVRRSIQSREGAKAKAEGRRNRAARLHRDVTMLRTWINDKARCNRPTIDAAVFGYIVGTAYSDAESFKELKAELESLGHVGMFNGLTVDDLITIVDQL